MSVRGEDILIRTSGALFTRSLWVLTFCLEVSNGVVISILELRKHRCTRGTNKIKKKC